MEFSVGALVRETFNRGPYIEEFQAFTSSKINSVV